MKVLKALALGVLALAVALVGVRRCSTLPSLEGRSPSTALVDTAQTRLGRAIVPMAAAHPGLSGIYPLRESRNAFAARVLLARAAERSLDVQYYIWQADLSGTLLFNALRDAADRGVRVRLLLDDNNTTALDPTLSALNAHANIEVRLFNPFVIRSPRFIGYLTDFRRLNRRMHNKSFTADNQATIIGGRNVGDEYFDAAEGLVFVDLDVLAVGPVAADVSEDFDRYWASASSYPVDRLVRAVSTSKLAALASTARSIENSAAAAAYMKPVRNLSFVQELLEGTLPLEWAPTRALSDHPAKALGKAGPEDLLVHELTKLVGNPATHAEVISAYFVPSQASVDTFAALAGKGVQIRILTNALKRRTSRWCTPATPSGASRYWRPTLRYMSCNVGRLSDYVSTPHTRSPRNPGAEVPKAVLPSRAHLDQACTRRPSPWTAHACSSAHSTSILAHAISTRSWAL